MDRLDAMVDLTSRVINDLQEENVKLLDENEAMRWLIEKLVDIDFGLDAFSDIYNGYADEIEDMEFIDGLIYAAKRHLEDNYDE